MESLVDLLVNVPVKFIQDSAIKHDGICFWRFSQMLDPVRSIISKSGETKGGICEMLAAKWLRDATTPGMTSTMVDQQGNLRRDVLTQIAMATVSSTLSEQQVATKSWLEAGPSSLDELNMIDMEGSTAPGSAKRDIPALLLRALQNRRTGTTVLPPVLALIGFAGRTTLTGVNAHAVAIKITAQGATRYFDPNFGEFQFNSWNRFSNWMPDYFKISLYSRLLSHEYNVRYFRSRKADAAQIPPLNLPGPSLGL